MKTVTFAIAAIFCFPLTAKSQTPDYNMLPTCIGVAKVSDMISKKETISSETESKLFNLWVQESNRTGKNVTKDMYNGLVVNSAELMVEYLKNNRSTEISKITESCRVILSAAFQMIK